MRLFVLAIAVCAVASSATLLAQGTGSRLLPPEKPTGSRLERDSSDVDGRERAMMLQAFANCVQTTKQHQVEYFLRNSDDLKFTDQIRDIVKYLALEHCVVDGANARINAVGARFQTQNLRGWLSEYAYKSHFSQVPAAIVSPEAGVEPSPKRFFSEGQNLGLALARSQFAECIARENAAGADALIRTSWGSVEERNAARALAPTLGQCLPEGRTMSLRTENVRMFAAVGLWQLQVEPKPASTKGHP